jgi:2-oxoglutarate dehydrogenase E1 component
MQRDVLALSGSLTFVDELYEQYCDSPNDVDPSWVAEFGLPPRPPARTNGHSTQPPIASSETLRDAGASAAAVGLVNAFRSRGHFDAALDPLGLVEVLPQDELTASGWGVNGSDEAAIVAGHGVASLGAIALRDLVAHLRRVYSGTVGLEFMHIASAGKRGWLAAKMESQLLTPVDAKTQRLILNSLISAEQFERFCHVKYPGTKRFSLEGSETLIPALELVLTHGARLGAIEAVIGMAHRGRLTTLTQLMKRAPRDLFAEFEDVEPEASMGGGDVKYHLGYSTDRVDANGKHMHVSLSFNPSHLEAVDPVVLGRVRAKQTRHGDVEHRQVMGVLVHGDAAFAGQGLVPECLNLMNLPGYRTGGTVHLVVNNQVGFTASPAEQRSTPYCTDVAKMIECPIWHVNGEDADAVARVIEMAMEYRTQFASDVIIDMYCFRKYGHNEMDEPSFTQPLMYERIQKKESPVDVYTRKLLGQGTVDAAYVATTTAGFVAALETELGAAKATKQRPKLSAMSAMWRGYRADKYTAPDEVDTRVSRERLAEISASLTSVPDGFTPHPKIVRLLEQRAQMGRGEKSLDWGMAEILAYGSLLRQGTNVRLTGQDCGRGTFSHRHAVIADVKNGSEHLVLGRLHADQGQCRIYDSPLSEAGVLGFEFGYSLDYPDALVLWEAQFGDFANGAQVIIDQFIVASEDKWNRYSGLTLLLPHGYEGQGPEHSSARLERFLQSAAEENIQVAQPSTPAQMFHLLRRQAMRGWRKPLIVMTPKSLLRLPAAASTIDELADGKFHRVMHDSTAVPAKVTRVLFCSGRIYYDLVDERTKLNDETVAIVRIEKLYPWWDECVVASMMNYSNLKDVMWVQDEPANMGPQFFVAPRLEKLASERKTRFTAVSRLESASPATGSHKAHVLEQQQILRAAFAAK